ncbi:RNA polymerase sigma-70 factor [Pedobacter panaciterrae]|jgi:RNA polymerase sigma-70 factor, Bacteroides expansion family 1|uniref:RNA polymerase sigma factor n=1 Tax=Pedobacter panaciterrae TaxID=363849 RepID=UPI00155DA944|nr:RNA polymerase sigma-70 factor [Pedobacter panaciterrae]NQX54265.1 RNA polymerase sigma-70 factor [Pedobacter panaciterrae]
MNLNSQFSDYQLIQLVKAGDHNAFSEIYNRYWGILYVHCLKMLKDEAEAQDVVQDLFITFWTKSAELDLKTNLVGYLYITARHKVLNTIRKRKTSDKFIEALGAYAATHNDSVIDQISERELAAAIEAEIKNLPKKMREVFEYSRKEYLSHREIADQLGISDKTVKKQVANAIRILRLRLTVPATLLIMVAWYLNK